MVSLSQSGNRGTGLDVVRAGCESGEAERAVGLSRRPIGRAVFQRCPQANRHRDGDCTHVVLNHPGDGRPLFQGDIDPSDHFASPDSDGTRFAVLVGVLVVLTDQAR